MKVLKENVSVLEICHSYLLSELGTIAPSINSEDILTKVQKDIEAKNEEETWRLMEALSGAYRINGAFSWLSNDALIWNLEEWPIEDIKLTHVTPAVNIVLEKVDFDLNKFSTYLKEYYQKYPDTDPEGLDEFRDFSTRKIMHTKMLGFEEAGKIKLLDGMHRTVALYLQGKKNLELYVARNNAVKNKDGTKLVAAYPIYTLWYIAQKNYDENKKIFDATVTVTSALKGKFRNLEEILQSCIAHRPNDMATKEFVSQVLSN